VTKRLGTILTITLHFGAKPREASSDTAGDYDSFYGLARATTGGIEVTMPSGMLNSDLVFEVLQ